MKLCQFPFLVFLIFCACSPKPADPPKKLNILLIVADDLGYADLGSFGGDIETPNLDELAKRGIRFSRFHTAPYCAVTRAMLLSGNFNHVAGMGSQSLVTETAGYEGKLSDRIIPLPSLLRQEGYHTYMVGKWHLGNTIDARPPQKGFERSFSIAEGGANHYSERGIFTEEPTTIYLENGSATPWPKGAYSTDFYTDKLISYVDENHGDGKPFFAYAAYTSPHWPLQVDEKYWRKYEGRYDEGYEKLKEKRFESLKKAGMIPKEAILPPSHPDIKPWDSLSPQEQKKEARKMELYAGMVDNLDHNIGRLIQHLKEIGAYDNTLIVFMSDNGAAGEDFYYSDFYGPFLKEKYSDSYEEMGTENSYISYGPQWAEAGSAPFKYYKGFTTEGGMNTPMIISGPELENIGQINEAFLSVLDLAPTFYELAGITYPKIWNGEEVQAPAGESLLPLLYGKSTLVHDSTYVFGLEHQGYAMLRKGDWKLLNLSRPSDTAKFELYNISEDLGEQNDLSKSTPKKYQEMLTEWGSWSQKVGVIIPTPKAKDNK